MNGVIDAQEREHLTASDKSCVIFSASDTDHKLVHQSVLRWVIEGNVW